MSTFGHEMVFVTGSNTITFSVDVEFRWKTLDVYVKGHRIGMSLVKGVNLIDLGYVFFWLASIGTE